MRLSVTAARCLVVGHLGVQLWTISGCSAGLALRSPGLTCWRRAGGRRLVRHPRTDHVGWRLKNVSYCSSSARPPPPCAGLLRRTGRVFERPPHDPARPSVFSRTHPATRSRASPAWLSRLLVRGSPLGLSLRLDAPPPRTRSLAVRRILVSSDDGRALRVLPPCPDRPRPPSRRLGELPCC